MCPMPGWTTARPRSVTKSRSNRHFYVYNPLRPLDQIEADITKLEGKIAKLLKGLVA